MLGILFDVIVYLGIIITYLLLYSSPLVAIISCYCLIKKIDYSTKVGNLAALFIILLNIPPILLTAIGVILYSLKFFMQSNEVYKWMNETSTPFFAISLLCPFIVLLLYIILYIKNKTVNHYRRKKNEI